MNQEQKQAEDPRRERECAEIANQERERAEIAEQEQKQAGPLRQDQGQKDSFMLREKEYYAMLQQELERRKDENVDITFREVRKNNGIYRNACTVRYNDAQVAPTIYLEPYYDHYLRGEAVAESAENILQYCRRKTPEIAFPENFFRDYETVRGRLGFKLIGTARNRALLRDIPHVPVEDMSAVFFYLLEDPAFGNGMIIVRNADMERWGKTPGGLYEEALENCPRMLPPVFRPLSDILDLMHVAGEGELYLLTNNSTLYGAAAILYPGMMQEVGSYLKRPYFILPSSVHEMILLPDRGEDAAGLHEIVEEINRTQVLGEEVLTDSVYHFTPGDSALRRVA